MINKINILFKISFPDSIGCKFVYNTFVVNVFGFFTVVYYVTNYCQIVLSYNLPPQNNIF